jgi:hypothetical protein
LVGNSSVNTFPRHALLTIEGHPLLGNGPIKAELRVELRSVNQRATEAEESPLVRFVIRKRLVKTRQRNSHCGELLPRLVETDGEDLACSDF